MGERVRQGNWHLRDTRSTQKLRVLNRSLPECLFLLPCCRCVRTAWCEDDADDLVNGCLGQVPGRREPAGQGGSDVDGGSCRPEHRDVSGAVACRRHLMRRDAEAAGVPGQQGGLGGREDVPESAVAIGLGADVGVDTEAAGEVRDARDAQEAKKILDKSAAGRVQVENGATTPQATGGSIFVDIRNVEPNQSQPRQYFDDAALAELAESIKAFGIVQPLLVKDNGGQYTIIAGERRYRAARIAKLTEVPVIIKEYTEIESLQVALIENIQRQDLTPIEEANCFKRLMVDFFFSADDIAIKLGKSKHAIIGALHLLELTPRAQELAAEGKLTASHAKPLLSVEDPDMQAACAERIVQEGLSVRAAETMIAQVLKAAAKQAEESSAQDIQPLEDSALKSSRDAAYRNAEAELQRILGSNVHIRTGKKSNKIEIEYYSVADLERILDIFNKL